MNDLKVKVSDLQDKIDLIESYNQELFQKYLREDVLVKIHYDRLEIMKEIESKYGFIDINALEKKFKNKMYNFESFLKNGLPDDTYDVEALLLILLFT